MRTYMFRGFYPTEKGNKTITISGKKIKGKWLYGNLFANLMNGKYAIYQLNGGYEVITETVREYVGLSDKNSKNIFEADIVKVKLYQNGGWKYCIGVIDFMQSACGYWIYVQNGYNVALSDSQKDIEVIGNIYENPELLEVEE